jgi:hypothetical protein
MFGNFGGNSVRIVPIIKNSTSVTAELKDDTYSAIGLLSSNNQIFNGMTEAKYGPDGALYILARGGQYGSPKGLVKVTLLLPVHHPTKIVIEQTSTIPIYIRLH